MAIVNSELLNYQRKNTSGPFRVKQTHRCCLIACVQRSSSAHAHKHTPD